MTNQEENVDFFWDAGIVMSMPTGSNRDVDQ